MSECDGSNDYIDRFITAEAKIRRFQKILEKKEFEYGLTILEDYNEFFAMYLHRVEGKK